MATKMIKQGSDVWFVDEPCQNPLPKAQPIDCSVQAKINEGRRLLMDAACEIARYDDVLMDYLLRDIENTATNLSRSASARENNYERNFLQ